MYHLGIICNPYLLLITTVNYSKIRSRRSRLIKLRTINNMFSNRTRRVNFWARADTGGSSPFREMFVNPRGQPAFCATDIVDSTTAFKFVNNLGSVKQIEVVFERANRDRPSTEHDNRRGRRIRTFHRAENTCTKVFRVRLSLKGNPNIHRLTFRTDQSVRFTLIRKRSNINLSG